MAVPVLDETNTGNILETTNLEVVYSDAVVALRGVSLEVREGSFTTVLGSNGAGKTTLVRTVSGLLLVHDAKIREGEIRLHGERMNTWQSKKIVKHGVCQVPEGRMLFPSLTVDENLRVGASTRHDRGSINDDLERIYGLFPLIADRRDDNAGLLSGGEQQMVAIGRALMSNPTLLVCDELSLGLAPQITRTLFDLIGRLNKEQGVSILLIEQNARIALEYADYGYILETGRVVLDGTARALRDNEDVREFYLGGSAEMQAAYQSIKHYKKRKRWLA